MQGVFTCMYIYKARPTCHFLQSIPQDISRSRSPIRAQGHLSPEKQWLSKMNSISRQPQNKRTRGFWSELLPTLPGSENNKENKTKHQCDNLWQVKVNMLGTHFMYQWNKTEKLSNVSTCINYSNWSYDSWNPFCSKWQQKEFTCLMGPVCLGIFDMFKINVQLGTPRIHFLCSVRVVYMPCLISMGCFPGHTVGSCCFHTIRSCCFHTGHQKLLFPHHQKLLPGAHHLGQQRVRHQAWSPPCWGNIWNIWMGSTNLKLCNTHVKNNKLVSQQVAFIIFCVCTYLVRISWDVSSTALQTRTRRTTRAPRWLIGAPCRLIGAQRRLTARTPRRLIGVPRWLTARTPCHCYCILLEDGIWQVVISFSVWNIITR